MASVIIDGVTYTTATALKAAAQARVRKMRPNYKPTRWWPDQFWKDVIALHPNMAEKIDQIGGQSNFLGYGLTILGKDPQMGVLGKDGRFVSFGWNECVKAPFRRAKAAPTPVSVSANWLATAKRGMRRAIATQVTTAKDAAREADGKITCVETGERLWSHEIHADHDPLPFDQIASDFLTYVLTHTNVAPGLVATSAADPMNDQFSDPTLLKDWKDYHYALATYRMVKAVVNLTKVTP